VSETLNSGPWRRVVYRFRAVMVLLSVLSVAALAFAPSGSAAPQTGPSASTSATQKSETTTTPGKSPHSPLCQKVRRADKHDKALGFAQIQRLPTWKAWQAFLLAYFGELYTNSQAVIDLGNNVPASVRTAASAEVSNIKVAQNVIRMAKSTDGLNVPNAIEKLLLYSFGPVVEYVGEQCGSTQTSGSSWFSQLPVTLSPSPRQKTLTP
jgi:hypothetical protein